MVFWGNSMCPVNAKHDLGRIEHFEDRPFCPYHSQHAGNNISVMEIHIRAAGVEDLKHILHHRRAMFEEMGFQDPAVLDNVESLSREYFSEALRIGRYR